MYYTVEKSLEEDINNPSLEYEVFQQDWDNSDDAYNQYREDNIYKSLKYKEDGTKDI